MIILFVLLPSLVLGADSAIDWTKCDVNKCFCKDGLTSLSYIYDATTAVQSCEKFGIQNIFLSEKIAIFLLQIKGLDANNLGTNPELSISNQYSGSHTNLFGCALKDGKVTLTGDAELLKKFKIRLFEEGDRGSLGDASYFKNGNIRCAIVAAKANKIYQEVAELSRSYMNLYTGQIRRKLFIADNTLFMKKSIKCPYYALASDPLKKKPYPHKPVYGSDKDFMNCEYYGDSFTMRYMNESNSEGDIERIECNYVNEKYNLFLVRNTTKANGDIVPEKEKIVNPETYAVFCAAETDELCANPMTCVPGRNCPRYYAGSKGATARLECTDDKWIIKGQYHNVTVACKRDESGKTNGAAFFAKLTSGQSVKITETAQCFTEYDCVKKSHVRLSAATVLTEGGVMKCKDEEKQLTIYHEETNETLNSSSSYACDTKDGSWKNDTLVVPVGSQATCKGRKKPTTIRTVAKMSDLQGTLLAIGISALIIFLSLGGMAVFYLCWKRGLSKNIKFKGIIGKELKNMPRSELIADCKEDFGMFLLATPSTDHLILEGLKKIEMMLKAGVEDGDAWEEAYKFLMRFHGSIRRIDQPIWHMLSRYLYLETKKIIDKHGWRTVEPIRYDNQKGLIRAVAVHLLSFSLHDRKNPDSEKLLLSGYLALGFRCTSQYPHCGLMWALVYHTRPFMRRRKADHADRRNFNNDKFEAALKTTLKTPCKIPRDQLIPAFGSVQHQASFASGALPDAAYIHSNAEDIMLKTKEQVKQDVSKGYFEGLCQSIMRNPIESIVSAFRMSAPNPTVLGMMHKVAPDEEWNAIAKDGERTMTYYGKHMDAKRLHERFMPDDKDTDFFKMQMEQKEFEEAVEKARPELRDWFAARTDIEEFKQKPEEFIDPNVKLDKKFGDYVPKPLPNAAAASVNQSQSGSNSGGSSGSNTKDGKTPAPPPTSEPKEAAPAAPAAAAAAPASK